MGPSWNPEVVLDVSPRFRPFHCVGTTRQGLRCRNSMIKHDYLNEAQSILDNLPELDYCRTNAECLVQTLERLAWPTLCPRWHQYRIPQAGLVADKWLRVILDLDRRTSVSRTTPTYHYPIASLPTPPPSRGSSVMDLSLMSHSPSQTLARSSTSLQNFGTTPNPSAIAQTRQHWANIQATSPANRATTSNQVRQILPSQSINGGQLDAPRPIPYSPPASPSSISSTGSVRSARTTQSTVQENQRLLAEVEALRAQIQAHERADQSRSVVARSPPATPSSGSPSSSSRRSPPVIQISLNIAVAGQASQSSSGRSTPQASSADSDDPHTSNDRNNQTPSRPPTNARGSLFADRSRQSALSNAAVTNANAATINEVVEAIESAVSRFASRPNARSNAPSPSSRRSISPLSEISDIPPLGPALMSPPLSPIPHYPPGSLSISSNSTEREIHVASPSASGFSTPELLSAPQSPVAGPLVVAPLPPQQASGPRPVRRRELEDCYICIEPILWPNDAVWCRGSCGKNVHIECFQAWDEFHSEVDPVSQCGHCRAPWVF